MRCPANGRSPGFRMVRFRAQRVFRHSIARFAVQGMDFSSLRAQLEPLGDLMYNLAQDVRYAFRALQRAPGFALAAILSLALGIGANTAIFTVFNAALLRPLQVEQPE